MGTTNREGKPISGVSGCVWLPPTTNHQPPANLGAFVSTARYGGFGFGEWTSISNQLVWCELFPLEDMRMFWLCMFCYASWTCQTESFDNLHMSTSLWVLEKKCHIHDMKQGQCRKEQLHMWSLQQTNFWSQNPSTGLPSPIWPQEIPHFPHLNIVLLFISFHYIPINLLVICIRIYIYIFPTFFVKSSYVPNFFRDASHCLRWPYFMWCCTVRHVCHSLKTCAIPNSNMSKNSPPVVQKATPLDWRKIHGKGPYFHGKDFLHGLL